jgi:hypothetical protein
MPVSPPTAQDAVKATTRLLRAGWHPIQIEALTILSARMGGKPSGVYVVDFHHRVDHGDSGSPVWNPRTGRSIGIVSAYAEGTHLSIVTPLLHPDGLRLSRVPGVLHDSDMVDLHLITGG